MFNAKVKLGYTEYNELWDNLTTQSKTIEIDGDTLFSLDDNDNAFTSAAEYGVSKFMELQDTTENKLHLRSMEIEVYEK